MHICDQPRDRAERAIGRPFRPISPGVRQLPPPRPLTHASPVLTGRVRPRKFWLRLGYTAGRSRDKRGRSEPTRAGVRDDADAATRTCLACTIALANDSPEHPGTGQHPAPSWGNQRVLLDPGRGRAPSYSCAWCRSVQPLRGRRERYTRSSNGRPCGCTRCRGSN